MADFQLLTKRNAKAAQDSPMLVCTTGRSAPRTLSRRVMSLSNLPTPIQWFLSALQTGDRDALRAALAEDASLMDENQEYRGASISTWFQTHFCRRTKTLRPINCARSAGGVVLTILTDETDPSGRALEVERDCRFSTTAEHITAVRIQRRERPALPAPIAAYVRATNLWDLDALVATFDDGALVNDQLCEHWGRPKIREWAEREIIGVRLTMYIVEALQIDSNCVLTANVNGNFDKRGLPDPLVLNFYFSARQDRITQLIILRNQPYA